MLMESKTALKEHKFEIGQRLVEGRHDAIARFDLRPSRSALEVEGVIAVEHRELYLLAVAGPKSTGQTSTRAQVQ
jgi:hypothetical protein